MTNVDFPLLQVSKGEKMTSAREAVAWQVTPLCEYFFPPYTYNYITSNWMVKYQRITLTWLVLVVGLDSRESDIFWPSFEHPTFL